MSATWWSTSKGEHIELSAMSTPQLINSFKKFGRSEYRNEDGTKQTAEQHFNLFDAFIVEFGSRDMDPPRVEQGGELSKDDEA